MVDTANRNLMADALRDYVAGRIHSGVFDRRIQDATDSDEKALFELFLALWGTYDDFKDRPFSADAVKYLCFKRCYAFLRSAAEYTYRPKPFGLFDIFQKRGAQPSFWPFSSQAQWRAHRHLADDFPSPDACVAISARAWFYPKPTKRKHHRSFRLTN